MYYPCSPLLAGAEYAVDKQDIWEIWFAWHPVKYETSKEVAFFRFVKRRQKMAMRGNDTENSKMRWIYEPVDSE